MKKILAILLALCLGLSLAACDGGEAATESTAGEDTNYTVTVHNASGAKLTNVEYYVYKDASRKSGILSYGTLSGNGKIAFTAPKSQEYILVLEGVSEGYDVQESYALTQADTSIVLTSSVIQGKDATDREYEYMHGEIMVDFSVTDTDGVTHTVSELLKTKKAVVLNFWNLKCSPCKAEFPNLQKAYEAYQDDIAVIAMDCEAADTEEGIREFKSQNGLSFPMAKCDEAWRFAMASMGDPTTVIIDRYGMICVKETGAIYEEGVFEAVFAHFAAEDYEQTLIRSMEEFAAKQQDAA